ncbi:MAG: LptE family protein [Candidatus Omnitrophica bacterium]|nr:LptE family protein [Candidatus Omnitrophota bacterium]
MSRLFLSILLVLTIAGCGYTTGSLLPKNYKKIAIEPFQNKVNNSQENSNVIYVPLLESNVRTAIIDKFLFDGNLRIADPDKADLVLNGDLIGVEQDTLRQDVNQNVQEYRVRIIVSLSLTDTATGKVLWKEPSFSGETTYFLTGSQGQSQSSAIDAALADLASRIVERTVENW